ncbi:MAG: oxysterol-binding protein [archaeon]|nr:oxysterol-binding protein [archaeon]
MEIQIFHYAGVFSGFVKKTMVFQKDGIILKETIPGEPKPIMTYFPLFDAEAIPSEKIDEFYIQIDEDQKVEFKANSPQEKKFVLQKLTEKINEIKQRNMFSKDFHLYSSEIQKKSNENKFDSITINLTTLMNYFLEFQNKISDLKRFGATLKLNAKLNKSYQQYIEGLNELEVQMRNNYDDLVKNIYDYRDDIDPAYADEKAKNQAELAQSGSKEEKKEEKKQRDPNAISLTYTPDPLYNWEKRKTFNKVLKVNPNLIQELIKAAAQKKTALPIYFNEPISMLQKECEKFYNSSFLDKAVAEEVPENKFLHISAFILSELSFNGGRTLKPFTPLLGETYEFCDNEKKWRYFGEQVYRKEHTSAFYCEGEGWTVNGDTRNKYSLSVFKGAAEIVFGSKTHMKIYNKVSKKVETFIFNRPVTQMKGLMKKNLHYDFSGTVNIVNLDQPNITCEINFLEETTKREIGGVEGKITKDGNVIYLINGNWLKEIFYTDKDGNNKQTLVEVPSSKHLSNTNDDYVLPEYSYRLNENTEELKKVLPSSDSRFRPDQLEFEVGSEEESQRIKDIIEVLQTNRQKKLDEGEKEYKAAYFADEYDEGSKDFHYKYLGGYWEQRANGKYENNKFNVFNLEEDKEIDETI